MTIGRLTADQIRSATFERAPFGRKGIDEDQVHDYLDQLADLLAQRDAELARLTTENRTLKHALREWHRQLVGYDAVDLIARTQQQIEAQIAQAEQYSREREEEAVRRYDEILAEARELVPEPVIPSPAADDEFVGRQRMYAGALLQALESLAMQVDATKHAFSFEVGKLVDLTERSTDNLIDITDD